ncbi:hypothetical protein Lal_00018780 [Lupinus albus]|nr:hypothetical protein Lal_00018780 [Lupinus albus]
MSTYIIYDRLYKCQGAKGGERRVYRLEKGRDMIPRFLINKKLKRRVKRPNILIPIYKNKGDRQNSTNCRSCAWTIYLSRHLMDIYSRNQKELHMIWRRRMIGYLERFCGNI